MGEREREKLLKVGEERRIEVEDNRGRLARINTLFLPQSERETPISETSFVIVGGWRTPARNIEVIAGAFARFAPTLIISQPEAPDSWIPKGPFNGKDFSNTGHVQLEIIKKLIKEGKLTGKIVLVGWSQGGTSLLEATAQDKEGLIDTLVLADPAATLKQVWLRMLFNFATLGKEIVKEGLKRHQETKAKMGRRERMREAVEEMILVRQRLWPKEEKGIPSPGRRKTMWRNSKLLARDVARKARNNVRSKVILLWGEKDAVLPLERFRGPTKRNLREEFPLAPEFRLRVVKGKGHDWMATEADLFSVKVVDLLKRD